MILLESRNLSKIYMAGTRNIPVLKNVSIQIQSSEFVAIQGKSGSGKTTLLSLMAGLDKPSEGRIIFDGADITDWSEDRLAPFRNQMMGFVFQSFYLVPSLTALENIMFPAELNRDRQARKKAEKLLQQVELEDRADNLPHQLSGGEKQRIAICRAVINRPRLIFADEPTGNLDTENSQIVLNILIQMQQEHGAALILVTHSQFIAGLSNRVIVLKDGAISR
ncbi:MAG TPA: ABC transporter ATP-binding protein [Desulfatirhabdiaceae bacterium]|nr:ABC transporter ATP-binding protein [Desulfatirhabdiaceae bacterium]